MPEMRPDLVDIVDDVVRYLSSEDRKEFIDYCAYRFCIHCGGDCGCECSERKAKRIESKIARLKKELADSKDEVKQLEYEIEEMHERE